MGDAGRSGVLRFWFGVRPTGSDQTTGGVPRLPKIREITKRTRKTMNRILAIHAAVPAMTPKPKIAAMIATTRNTMAQ